MIQITDIVGNCNLKTLSPSNIVMATLVALISFCILLAVHGNIMLEPNSFMLSKEGEAIRLHYVMAYHAKYDSSYVNFEGMNYPFGEHMIYCDAQPLMNNGFKWVSSTFSEAGNYTIGVQNVISLYGLILGAVLYFFVLVRWRLPAWYAAMASLAIMLLGPQIIRMPWHPSLAYAFFIPGSILLYQNYFRSKSWFSAFWIFAWSLAAYFINPYFGVMTAALFGLMNLLIFKLIDWKQLSQYGKAAVQVLAPGLIYQLWGSLTDHRTDRVQLPTGLHEFTANLSTYFSSPYTGFAEYFDFLGADINDLYAHFEGLSYLGIFVIILLFVFTIRWFFRLVLRKPTWQYLKPEQRQLIPIIVAFAILSMGIPFVLHPAFEDLLSLFKPLRQLRALGRFAWFPTILTQLLCITLVYRWIMGALNSKILQGLSLCAVMAGLGLMIFEGISLHQETNTHQYAGNALIFDDFTEDIAFQHLRDAKEAIDPSEYQAIVPIPYYHTGSELFLPKTHTSYRAMLEVLAYSYEVNLPVTSCYLSRISRTESRKALQLFSLGMMKKEIAQDFPDDRPLLLFHSKCVVKLSVEEKRLLKMGNTVFESKSARLVSIRPSQIWKMENDMVYSWYTENQDHYTEINGVKFSGNVAPIRLSFDDQLHEHSFAGRGCFIQKKGEQKYLFDQFAHTETSRSGKYELSFWLETSLNRAQSVLVMERLNKDGTTISKEYLREASRSFTHMKNWMRWQTELEIIDGQFIRLWLEEPTDRPGIIVDELQLIPENCSVFVPLNSNKWLWNNYPFDIPSITP